VTTVVLADDQELVRGGLRFMVKARGVQVLGEAAHGREAVQLTRRLNLLGPLLPPDARNGDSPSRHGSRHTRPEPEAAGRSAMEHDVTGPP
jgi:hypothetical protein